MQGGKKVTEREIEGRKEREREREGKRKRERRRELHVHYDSVGIDDIFVTSFFSFSG